MASIERPTGTRRASRFRGVSFSDGPLSGSLFASGLPARLLLAAGLSGLVWLSVAWALAA